MIWAILKPFVGGRTLPAGLVCGSYDDAERLALARHGAGVQLVDANEAAADHPVVARWLAGRCAVDDEVTGEQAGEGAVKRNGPRTGLLL